jgi:hypothetical protein
MIGREEARLPVDLLAEAEGSPRDRHAVGRALLADRRLAPEHARVAVVTPLSFSTCRTRRCSPS